MYAQCFSQKDEDEERLGRGNNPTIVNSRIKQSHFPQSNKPIVQLIKTNIGHTVIFTRYCIKYRNNTIAKGRLFGLRFGGSLLLICHDS